METKLRTFFSFHFCAFGPVAFVLLTLSLRSFFSFLFPACLSVLLLSLWLSESKGGCRKERKTGSKGEQDKRHKMQGEQKQTDTETLK